MFEQEDPLKFQQQVNNDFSISSKHLGQLIRETAVGTERNKKRKSTSITLTLARLFKREELELKGTITHKGRHKPYSIDADAVRTILGWEKKSPTPEHSLGIGSINLPILHRALIHAIKTSNSATSSRARNAGVTGGIAE